ncbi:MAG: hypothetical protein N4A45_10495 [Flavobacteriales bacterium]|jgi:hypothetical protein|nr:hypothetical protein [Flavobacteriales bacterium]
MSKKENITISYKAFDKGYKCRDYQFEEGKTHEVEGEVIPCENGFHACENPFDVSNYYGFNNSNYAVVEQTGIVKKEGDKTVSSKLRIKAKLSLLDFIKIKVQWAKDNFSTTTGYKAHATTTGDYAHATTTGDYAHATTTGDEAHATTTGDEAHATTTGDEAIASALGVKSKAMAKNGWIVVADWRYINHKWTINNIHSVKVGGEILEVQIKPNTFYWFEDGQLKSSENEN